MAGEGRIDDVGERYKFICPILKLEKRLFGWRYEGVGKVEHLDGYEGSVNDYGEVRITEKKSIFKYAYFSRPSIYPKNLLFSLLEGISNAVSLIRRMLQELFIIGIIITLFAGAEGIALMLLGVYAGMCVVSIAVAILGRIARAIFGLDNKCNERLRQYGYEEWDFN